MRRRWAWVLARAAACVTTLAGAQALADDVHYQDYVVGGRAVGLGGAFTALSDDPSGAYYNPAGLADVRHSSVDVSTNLYGIERGRTGSGVSEIFKDARSFDFSFQDINVVPSTFGGAKGFGARRDDGTYAHVVAISLIVPSFRNVLLSSQSAGTDADGSLLQTSFRHRAQDRTFWAGVSYARRLELDPLPDDGTGKREAFLPGPEGDAARGRLSIGVSAFYVLRTVEQFEESSLARTPVDGPSQFSQTSTELSFLNGNLLLLVGSKLRLTEKLRLGLSLESPTIPINADGRLRITRSGALPADGGTELRPYYERPEFDVANSNTVSWFAGRAGVAYVEPYRYTLSLDLSFHAPSSYTLLSISSATDSGMTAGNASPVEVPLVTSVTRESVMNLNAGAEWLFSRNWSVAAGFYTDFSSAPPIPELPQRDMLSDVDLVGFTGSIGHYDDHTLVRLGGMYAFGSGHDVVARERSDGTIETSSGAVEYTRVPLFQSFLYVFLASGFRY